MEELWRSADDIANSEACPSLNLFVLAILCILIVVLLDLTRFFFFFSILAALVALRALALGNSMVFCARLSLKRFLRRKHLCPVNHKSTVHHAIKVWPG